MNYQDKWGRFHHKPCVNGEHSSNNGWIYTAYAKKAGVPVDERKLSQCFDDCRVYYEAKSDYILNRHPDKSSVPISRDEILGMAYLGLLKDYDLGDKETGATLSWNFSPFIVPKFSLIKLVKQLWEIRPSLVRREELPFDPRRPMEYRYKLEFHHRNYFWQNNLDQLYRFAFSVPLQDRHFILKCWGKFQWYNPVHVFYACVAKIDSLLPKKSGIKWLKYGGEENKKAMVQEFPEDHPIRTKLGI